MNFTLPYNQSTLVTKHSPDLKRIEGVLKEVGFRKYSEEGLLEFSGASFMTMFFSGLHITTTVSSLKITIKDNEVLIFIKFKNLYLLLVVFNLLLVFSVFAFNQGQNLTVKLFIVPVICFSMLAFEINKLVTAKRIEKLLKGYL